MGKISEKEYQKLFMENIFSIKTVREKKLPVFLKKCKKIFFKLIVCVSIIQSYNIYQNIHNEHLLGLSHDYIYHDMIDFAKNNASFDKYENYLTTLMSDNKTEDYLEGQRIIYSLLKSNTFPVNYSYSNKNNNFVPARLDLTHEQKLSLLNIAVNTPVLQHAEDIIKYQKLSDNCGMLGYHGPLLLGCLINHSIGSKTQYNNTIDEINNKASIVQLAKQTGLLSH